MGGAVTGRYRPAPPLPKVTSPGPHAAHAPPAKPSCQLPFAPIQRKSEHQPRATKNPARRIQSSSDIEMSECEPKAVFGPQGEGQ
ncbi:hypothetical protein NDU88_012159 [Pleurodeles waltl]|uniref:Uncharacterized protein n=1 Tax=Pleurodeles waltl TaxID=8319 RepID=A0AAV7QZV8_PLEWA|nr:hypothetical protein NDU88_012159 [Pleurodeles waltl]